MSQKIFLIILLTSMNVFAAQTLQSTIVPAIGSKAKCQMVASPVLISVLKKLNIQSNDSYAACIQHLDEEFYGLVLVYPSQTSNYRVEVDLIEEESFSTTLVQVESRPRALTTNIYTLENNRIVTKQVFEGADYTVDVPIVFSYTLDTKENCEKFALDISKDNIKSSYIDSVCQEKDDGTFIMINIKMYQSGD